jgi:DNA-binding LacI/PurR family transcriptional regulator
MSTNSKPTLVSLARELGVSRQTVSNVINAPHVVKPETRDRVQRAIDASGYRPSALGRALRSNRSMNIGLRIHQRTDEINGTVMDRFLHALTDAAQDRGYRIVLFTARDDTGELGELEAMHSINGIDACVLTGTTVGDARPGRLLELGCPFVAFGRPWGALPGEHSWVDIGGAAGTRDATRALIERGHRNIGFIGWTTGSGTGDDRRSGWSEAMAGVVDDVASLDLQIEIDGVTSGAQAARELKARGASAVVCASDSLALGAYPVFENPSDAFLPVIGFDDTPVARALGLSSCAQPVEDAARFCVSTLLTLLTKKDADASDFQRVLDPHLVVRQRHGG